RIRRQSRCLPAALCPAMGSFRRRSVFVLGAAALVAVAVLSSADAQRAAAPESAKRSASPVQAALRKHGLLYRGLVPARSGPCRGVFVSPATHGPTACTHGPDPSPPGIDVRKAPSLHVLRERARRSRAKEDAGSLACYTGGNAIQGVYAHQAGADNYSD